MFVPSLFQKAIFDWVESPRERHGIVNAVAGSGKSRTLEEAVKVHIPPRDPLTMDWLKILMMSFNVHIAEAMSARMPKYVWSRTFNSFGWYICRQNVPTVTLKKNKTRAILANYVPPEMDRPRYNRLRPPIERMVSLLKALGEPNIERWREHAKFYGIEFEEVKTADRFEEVLGFVYKTSVDLVELMDYDDQVFQVIHRGWELPRFKWVMIDEFQDSSPVQMTFAERLAEYGRLLMVGDPDQSIYLFRGAHPNAMETIAKTLDAKVLPLSTCYRCSEAVIECAQEEVPRIQSPEVNAIGKGSVEQVTTAEFIRDVADGDLVLCRTTAPLIRRCLQLLSMNRKAYVLGKDLVEQVIQLVETTHGDPKELQAQAAMYRHTNQVPNFGMPMRVFLEKVSNYKAEQASMLIAQQRDDEISSLEDRVDGLLCFASCSRFVAEIILRVEDITSDESKDGVGFMTGHKCKGLEAERGKKTWLLRWDLTPHRKAKTDAQLKQEYNLRYVMKTRAREDLRIVEKERDEK